MATTFVCISALSALEAKQGIHTWVCTQVLVLLGMIL